MENLEKICKKVKETTSTISIMNNFKKKEVLIQVAEDIIKAKDTIIKANDRDIENAVNKKMKESLIDRLKLNEKRIKEIGKQITEEYKNKEIVIICILRGAVYFATDLTKYIDSNNLIMEFMQVSSYGNMKETTGELKIKKDLDVNIEGKNVIIVEDIIDSGFTMLNLKKYLLSKNPETLKVCTLLDKKDRRKVEVEADYVGFEIPNKFVLGYGLDYEEYYRNLPYIAYSED